MSRRRDLLNGQEIPYIGTQLRRRRVQLGLAQQEVADKLGITKGGFSAYEQDKIRPSLENLVKLAEVLGVSVEYLTGESEGEPEESVDGAADKTGRIGDRQMGIGKQIITLRQKKGISRQELASALNVSIDDVDKYERDTVSPSYETLIDMARLFGVSTESLFGIDSGKTIDISSLSDANKNLIKELVRNMR